jgi:serine protease
VTVFSVRVAGQVSASKKPSVANLSLGGGFSQTTNDAVERLVAAGVTTAVAAGNDNSDACNYSPASAPNVITVGATDKTNSKASYSNYGTCLDIWGPGSGITSAWIGSPSATNTISGTSMASPHICGVAAKYLSEDTSLTTSQVTAKVVSTATQNAISGITATSPNLIGYCNC